MDRRPSEGFPHPDLPSSLTSDDSTNISSDALSVTFSLLSLEPHGTINIRVPPSTATYNNQDNDSRRQSIEERTSELSELSLSTSYNQPVPRAELASTPTSDIGENFVVRYAFPPPTPTEPLRSNQHVFDNENIEQPPRLDLLNFQVDQNQDRELALAIAELENSPEGSPGAKWEEFVPSSSYFDPDKAHFRDRRYQRENVFSVVTYEGRLGTYYDWTSLYITKEVLAKWGFFYKGCGDKVYCCICNGGLDNWAEGDDPREEHFRAFRKYCL